MEEEIGDYSDRMAAIRQSLYAERPGNPTEFGRRPVDEKFALQKIPTCVDEYIELEGMSDWPEHITSEYPLDLNASAVFGDKDDIEEFLRKGAPLEAQLATLDKLEERLTQLNNSLTKYNDAILTEEERYSRIKNGTFYSNLDKRIQAAGMDEDYDPRAYEKSRQEAITGALNEKKRMDVNFIDYPGFNSKEFTDLPGQLEAPQLLHRITKAQHFNIGFAKFWKKIFLSEASLAVVQDLFWWCFMRIFKPNTQVQQDLVFDRLADSFAALFYSINPDIRDKVFKVYPNVLSQAIFMVFYDTFPESHRMYGPMFKDELISYCWELTTGTTPPPGTWNTWDLDSLQGKVPDSDGKVPITSNNLDSGVDNPQYDFAALHETLANLKTEMVDGEIATVEVTELAKPKRVKQATQKPESSYNGPGPQFEKVQFNLAGLSPLIAHFMNMKHLREINPAGRRIRRTEIRDQPTGSETFRDLIDRQKHESKEKKAVYAIKCKEAADEIARLEKDTAQTRREFNKLKQNLTPYKQAGLDLKFVTDRITAKKEIGMKDLQLVLPNGEVNRDRDSDSDFTDEELDKNIQAEISDKLGEYGLSNMLGGTRLDVLTVSKDPKKAAQRKEWKEYYSMSKIKGSDQKALSQKLAQLNATAGVYDEDKESWGSPYYDSDDSADNMPGYADTLSDISSNL